MLQNTQMEAVSIIYHKKHTPLLEVGLGTRRAIWECRPTATEITACGANADTNLLEDLVDM
jgi:hypothetical protein